jgi:uncharacterized membrane protein (DUF106 family)
MANNKNTGPDLTTLAAGAAVGAIAGAAAVVLSDPKKRAEMGKKMGELQKEGMKTLDELKGKAQKVQENMTKQVKTQLDNKKLDQKANGLKKVAKKATSKKSTTPARESREATSSAN